MKQLDDLLSVWERHKESGQNISAEELCRESPELLEEVRWHIRVLEEVDSKFGVENTLVRDAAGSHSPHVSRLNQEFQFSNRFQIAQHHASGGLGDVYVAIDPVLDRKVAIKFPKQSRLTAEQLARFEREARITGQLDHPGIVAVHALKLSDDSPPCYVMRFVQGSTLQERATEFHSHANQTSSGDRYLTMEFRELLQHFVTLCNIVGYAHEQGVIHRDIKPSNVILGAFGQTYLMDWGLARADGVRGPDLKGSVAVSESKSEPAIENGSTGNVPKGNASTQGYFSTKTGQIMGTPAFASPEQLRGLSGQIDHRSDVYSLGASLYFVLTGKLPVEAPNSADYLKRISEETESILTFGAAVPRPLAAICRAATAVAPLKRYQTPLALADDLQRYLASEPVSVLRETWPVRMQRWSRKHPRTAVGTLVALTLVTLFAVLAWIWSAGFNRQLAEINLQLSGSNSQLEQAHQAAQQARERAEANLETARGAVDEFLVKVSDHPRLNRDDFTDLQVELLSSARTFYENLLAHQPGEAGVEFSRAEAHHRLAQIERISGNNEAARKGYLAALEMIRQLPSASRQSTTVRLGEANCLNDYGLLLRQLGNPKGAKEQYLAALAVVEPLLTENPADLKLVNQAAGSHINLARVQVELGEREVAVEEVTRAIKILQVLADRGENDARLQEFLATGYKTRGNLYLETGDNEQAERDLQAAFEIAQAMLNEVPDSPDRLDLVAKLNNDLGLLNRACGELEAAAKELGQARDKWRDLAARFPTQKSLQMELANCLNNLGVTQSDAGQSAAAVESYEEALQVWRKLVERHPDQPALRSKLAMTLANLASELRQAGYWSQSGEYHRESVGIYEQFVREFPNNQFLQLSLAGAACNYGNYLREDDPAAALEWYDRAAKELQIILDQQAEHSNAKQFLRNTWLGRARSLQELARYTEAQDCWQSAASLSEGSDRKELEQLATQAGAMAEEAPRLDAIVAGTSDPTDDRERLKLAAHCFNRQLFARAAAEMEKVLATDQDRTGEEYFSGSRAAALAAAGKGTDTTELTDAERVHWRERSLEWLEQALQVMENDDAQVKIALRGWLTERDLASLRDPDDVAGLPEGEREKWEEFWKRVREMARD